MIERPCEAELSEEGQSRGGLHFVLVRGCSRCGDGDDGFWLLQWWFAAANVSLALLRIFPQLLNFVCEANNSMQPFKFKQAMK